MRQSLDLTVQDLCVSYVGDPRGRQYVTEREPGMEAVTFTPGPRLGLKSAGVLKIYFQSYVADRICGESCFFPT